MRFSAAVLVLLLVPVRHGFCGEGSIVTQPPPGFFKMRKELIGRHPRLYFSSGDIPAIRRNAAGPGKWFADRILEGFGGRYNSPMKAEVSGWEQYLYGFWGLVGADFLYVATGDTKYRNVAKTWSRYWLGRPDWGGDDLIPMDILSGLAITYDTLYNDLSDTERREMRERLFREAEAIRKRFFVGQYWTGDFQNNHMHNRIHGLANAAFAVYGDDPNIDVGPHADLACACAHKLAEWLPEDGSQHEGPGYWSYGHHWVVRTVHLVEHVTGEDLVSANPHFTNAHYFRIYMTAPGWKHTLGIGDSGDGPPGNLTAVSRIVAEAKDPYGQDWLHRMMRLNPGEFYQHPAWGLLWYDPSIKPRPVEELPLWRFWPDLEMFSIRSSWADDAAAFVFKCGPVGGHKLQNLRGAGWANVAHDHPDQNHFLLFSNGVFLAEDDGYPKEKKLTRSHNTIVIDGKGQPREGTGWQQPFDYSLTGFMRDVFLYHNFAYAAGDGGRLYDGADRFVRHVFFAGGDYLVLLDDLAGSGGRDHEYDWRLHKKGDWKDAGNGSFSVADGGVSLRIQFLHPADAGGSFFGPELTAPPGLSVRQTARDALFLAVLIPQKNGLPAVQARRLPASGCVAVEITTPRSTDVFAVASGKGPAKAGDVSFSGAAAFVRCESGKATGVFLVRGGSLRFKGKTLLSAPGDVNAAFRIDRNAVAVDAEAPYKSKGRKVSVSVGGFPSGRTFGLYKDGKRVSSARAGALGTVSLPLDLAERSSVLLK
ncbi:MAG: heparinase II/III family protein [Planctomycetes bacterium]|nr:heparinase II/III family protein [Planctomycetota bacterium]